MSKSFGKSKKGWSKKDKRRNKRPEKRKLASSRKLAKDRLNSRKDKQLKREQGNRMNVLNKKDCLMNKKSMKSSNS